MKFTQVSRNGNTITVQLVYPDSSGYEVGIGIKQGTGVHSQVLAVYVSIEQAKGLHAALGTMIEGAEKG